MSTHISLWCPFCKEPLRPPPADGSIVSCRGNGGDCRNTLYIRVGLTEGFEHLPSEKEALRKLYRRLTGRDWNPGDPNLADCDYARLGVLLPNGAMLREPPVDTAVRDFCGVTFMRLSTSEIKVRV